MRLEYKKELEKIKKILDANPHGTTIKEVSNKIGLNRNVVAKYLDVLQIAGQVEIEKFGRSKVYFPAHSVPLSSMFDFANDFIIVVRKDMTTVQINNPFVKYLGIESKKKIIGKKIDDLSFTKDHPKMTKDIIKALEDQQIHKDNISHKRKNSRKVDTFKAKFIPTTLTDGEQGVTIILSSP